jgi:hypothetical protein
LSKTNNENNIPTYVIPTYVKTIFSNIIRINTKLPILKSEEIDKKIKEYYTNEDIKLKIPSMKKINYFKSQIRNQEKKTISNNKLIDLMVNYKADTELLNSYYIENLLLFILFIYMLFIKNKNKEKLRLEYINEL